MTKLNKGANASVSSPIDNRSAVIKAVDLLDEAYAVALYVTLASDDRNECESITEMEKRGFHVVMQDMMERITKASALLDEVRLGGADHG